MAWTALSFAFASNLTSTKMTQLYNNAGAEASPGDYIENETHSVTQVAFPSSYTKHLELQVYRAGDFRVRMYLENAAGLGLVYARLYVNGVAVGTERVRSSGQTAYYNEDITLAPGDSLQLYIRSVGLGQAVCKVALMCVEPIPSGWLYTLDADWV